eukprot:CAMPEP_0115884372 /NCGR_PEP_ID=MMETSP0287-20121206/30082_1 /TAXON_ID=412157 /ORGANISM="Chrysochromulina rotalis, Strain UIO044" /LENGTH=38 /DNA_ID= /DNA_START= /DNA_END= /DNA_ORIENTATION=
MFPVEDGAALWSEEYEYAGKVVYTADGGAPCCGGGAKP